MHTAQCTQHNSSQQSCISALAKVWQNSSCKNTAVELALYA